MTTIRKKKKSESISDEKEEIKFINSSLYKDDHIYDYPSYVLKNPLDHIPVRQLDLNIIPPSVNNYLDSNITGSKIVIIGKPGTGKCLHPDTPVLTSTLQVKKAKDLTLEDKLLGDDHKERNILSLTKGNDNLYRIKQRFGMSYIVNSVHILTLCKDSEYIDVELRNVPYYLSEGWKGVRILPDCKKCEDCKECEISIEEYLKDSTKILFTPLNSRLNLLKRMVVKFGGMHYNIEGRYYTIPSVNTQEKEKISLVCDSIGIKCVAIREDDAEDKEYSMRIGIPSKNLDTFSLEGYKNIESEIFIEPIGEGEYVGFEIDGNKRFCLGDFTVTHNTTLIKSLLWEKQAVFPVGVVVSGTEDSNHSYEKFVPDLFIYNEYEEITFENFKKRQDVALQFLVPPEHNPWAFILFDDCTDEPKIFNRKIWQACYKNGRHWKMFHMLSLQYCMDMKRNIRFTVDGTFILRESNLQLRESLYKNYGGNIPSFEIFCDLMDIVTEDFTALYIHNRTSTNAWEDCVFFYKPNRERSKGGDIPDDWRAGCADFWDFHEARRLKN